MSSLIKKLQEKNVSLRNDMLAKFYIPYTFGTRTLSHKYIDWLERAIGIELFYPPLKFEGYTSYEQSKFFFKGNKLRNKYKILYKCLYTILVVVSIVLCPYL